MTRAHLPRQVLKDMEACGCMPNAATYCALTYACLGALPSPPHHNLASTYASRGALCKPPPLMGR